MALIDFYVRNQKLTKIGPKLVSDSINYVSCSFTFKTSDWYGMDKWVVFSKGEENYRVNLVEDRIPKEAVLNLGAGLWRVSLFGLNPEGTERITTNSVTVEVAKSTVLDGEPLPVIELSEAEQIATKAEKALETANEIKTKAENGEFNGEAGAPFTYDDFTEEQLLKLVGPQGPAGADGKSAYQYAKDGGYTGTEAEFEKKLAEEYPSEVAISSTEPTDPNIKVWIDPNEKLPLSAFENDVGFITEEDVPEAPQADLAQNDPNAADYVKNRTHWVEEVEEVLVEEQTFPAEEGGVMLLAPGEIETFDPNGSYTVKIDGTEYVCEVLNVYGVNFLGNPMFLTENPEDDNGLLFFLTANPEEGLGGAILTDEVMATGTATVGIVHKDTRYHKLDKKFADYYIIPIETDFKDISGTVYVSGDTKELAPYLLNGLPVYFDGKDYGAQMRLLLTNWRMISEEYGALTENTDSATPLFLYGTYQTLTSVESFVVGWNMSE